MTTLARRNSSIHKIREYQLEKVKLEDQYEVIQVLQEGWLGRLLLVEHRRTGNEVVLKAIHKTSSSRLDFFREFHYNYYLSPHLNILNAYDVAFETDEYYVFAQEYAPLGDLTTNLSDVGLGEINTKRIARQLASALDFMHSKELVHRDLNMDNILVFKSDFSHVKVCDFGATRKKGTLLKKRTVWLPYAPPEIVDAVQNEGFHADPAQDVWQLGVLVYVLLTGRLPWQKACVTDPHYSEYLSWRKRRSLRTPKRFANFTSRLLRLLKRLLEPKAEKRAAAKEVVKYLEDRWLVRGGRGRGGQDGGEADGQSVCYSSFSAHSCPKEKDRLLGPLKARGIETTVDRLAKRQRIHEWLERSAATACAAHGPAPAPPVPLLPRGEVTRHPQPAQVPAAAAATQDTTEAAAAAAAARRLQYEQVAALAVRAAAAAAARGDKLPRDANHNTRAPLAQAEDESPGAREAPWVPLQRSRTDSYLLGGSPRPPRHDHSRGASLDTDDSEDDDPRPPRQPLKPLPPLTLPRPTPAR
ncbi:serine/threonine-protein kinase SBK1-like [Eriocheir sinensis]|uniref:serine/threonine-protein kinase SBK1-like n=1 Tax=Eriocheir sinensis TaxID=95602 RepID=UPI0021CAADC0|nr:serine/threonine-protein kinase SBK1-like [Eriocheir sinensis]XP_050699793.1 serine/threonine-protein kinase SBK1-like [Eriocheir sinensis]XP_050699794.1 serine/threonine-protein kinase SBK1-like [Eriocheir sinensis]